LGCEPRTLRNYEKSEPYFPIISRAKTKIHESWIINGLNNRYNCKMVALCLTANNPDYRLNSDSNVNVMVTIEDKLRHAIEASRQARLEDQHGRQKALPEPEEVIDI
jgi:hypothetical protein